MLSFLSEYSPAFLILLNMDNVGKVLQILILLKSIRVNIVAFNVVLFEYSPTFLVLLSVDTTRRFTLILLLKYEH